MAAVVALAARGWAQTPPAPAASSSVVHWAGCGASFSSPGFAGWCALAVPVLTTQGLYSFSMYQMLPSAKKPPITATITGLALLLREWTGKTDSFSVYGIGAPVGVAITSSATQFNPAWGGMAIYKRKTGWTVEAGGIKNQTTGKVDWKLGGGLTW